MANGTGEKSAGETWKQLPRTPSHRTSKPTDEAIRRAVGEIAAARGSAPFVDAVILASLRLATRGDLNPLMDAVREIETGTYPAVRVPHDPGS